MKSVLMSYLLFGSSSSDPLTSLSLMLLLEIPESSERGDLSFITSTMLNFQLLASMCCNFFAPNVSDFVFFSPFFFFVMFNASSTDFNLDCKSFSCLIWYQLIKGSFEIFSLLMLMPRSSRFSGKSRFLTFSPLILAPALW